VDFEAKPIFKQVGETVKEKVKQKILMAAKGELTDEQVERIERYLDDDGRRHYQKPGLGDDVYSVTTILDEKEESDGLKYWRKANDGEGDNADWEHILEYKKNRGTLAHYAALSKFENHHIEPVLWSNDEKESLDELMERSGEQNTFLYSIMKDRGWVDSVAAFQEIYSEEENGDLSDILYSDLGYITQEFEDVCEQQGINEDTVVDVERMFAQPPEDGEHAGFGGQVDLIYEDPVTGDNVVADLKTSSNVYDKHKLQAAAYAYAAENNPELDAYPVDRAEIIRISPDKKQVQVKTLAKQDLKSYWDEFARMSRELDNVEEGEGGWETVTAAE